MAEVHHLLVLSYHLQHPSLYSPEGLAFGIRLLYDFIDGEKTPGEVRRQERTQVDSGKRFWKIKGTPESHGAYPHPVHWEMTARDVIVGGPENYEENVKAWARSLLKSLRESEL